jgi:2-polyprenyl-3-methyl-5-hydroxy-6-metoxy-1,4-benzoquinol methylase
LVVPIQAISLKITCAEAIFGQIKKATNRAEKAIKQAEIIFNLLDNTTFVFY